MGAALCAEYASGSNPVATLIDVTPISLGIELFDGSMSILGAEKYKLTNREKRNFFNR